MEHIYKIQPTFYLFLELYYLLMLSILFEVRPMQNLSLTVYFYAKLMGTLTSGGLQETLEVVYQFYYFNVGGSFKFPMFEKSCTPPKLL